MDAQVNVLPARVLQLSVWRSWFWLLSAWEFRNPAKPRLYVPHKQPFLLGCSRAKDLKLKVPRDCIEHPESTATCLNHPEPKPLTRGYPKQQTFIPKHWDLKYYITVYKYINIYIHTHVHCRHEKTYIHIHNIYMCNVHRESEYIETRTWALNCKTKELPKVPTGRSQAM